MHVGHVHRAVGGGGGGICILYGFPCEMDFSHHESPNSKTSGEKSSKLIPIYLNSRMAMLDQEGKFKKGSPNGDHVL